jgi:dienelactone hydrolase
MYKLIWTALLAGCLGTAQAAIKEEPITYKDADTTMRGYVVYDDAINGKRPGIVVVHEWWGITPHVRTEARKLAGQGYTAFVADMYGEGKTADNPKDAGALSGAVMGNPAVMRARFNAAMEALSKQRTVDASRIGAVGFCFGGSVVLDMARAGSDLVAVSAFHTGLVPTAGRAEPGVVKAKILVQNGADDPFVKAGSVEAFKAEMEAAKVDYRYISYPGAVHAFTNPDATALGKKFNLPIAYNAQVDKESKAESAKFLGQALKP